MQNRGGRGECQRHPLKLKKKKMNTSPGYMWQEREFVADRSPPQVSRSTEPERIKGGGEPAGQAGSQWRPVVQLRSPGRNAATPTAPPTQGGAAGTGRGWVWEGNRTGEGRKWGGRLHTTSRARPQAHLRSVSSAPSCLSSGRPSAARRSLLSSSAARQYWACSSPPLGYVCWINFTSGLARSTSEVFFSCTEMNVAMASTSIAFRPNKLRDSDEAGERGTPASTLADPPADGRALACDSVRPLPGASAQAPSLHRPLSREGFGLVAQLTWALLGLGCVMRAWLSSQGAFSPSSLVLRWVDRHFHLKVTIPPLEHLGAVPLL